MEKLVENGLFGNGLFTVSSPVLVERYNACLKAIGIAPTGLKEFRIDGIGWSPEISKEKGCIKYFSFGGMESANQFGILITPDQRGLPIYTPFNSFDRPVMEKLFRNSGKQIAELTAHSAVWLDFNKDILDLSSPYDLLMIEEVLVRVADVNGFINAAKEQRELVKIFRDSDTAWSDRTARAEVIQSAITHGDLRFKAFIAQDVHFTDMRSFYTRAFGGVYVFRDLAEYPLLVLESDKGEYAATSFALAHDINEALLPMILIQERVASLSLGWHKQHLDELTHLRDLVIADAFYKDPENAEMEFGSLTSAQIKQWIPAHEALLPSWFKELAHLITHLKKRESVKNLKVDETSGLVPLLLRPSYEALKSEETTKVVWQLLTRLAPYDVEQLYLCNRILFYDLYRSWPEGKKRWVVSYLKDRGHPHSR